MVLEDVVEEVTVDVGEHGVQLLLLQQGGAVPPALHSTVSGLERAESFRHQTLMTVPTGWVLRHASTNQGEKGHSTELEMAAHHV